MKSDTCCCREILHAAECCRLVTALCATVGALLRPCSSPRLSRLSHRLSPAAEVWAQMPPRQRVENRKKNVKAGLYEFYLKTIIMYKQTKYKTEIIILPSGFALCAYYQILRSLTDSFSWVLTNDRIGPPTGSLLGRRHCLRGAYCEWERITGKVFSECLVPYGMLCIELTSFL